MIELLFAFIESIPAPPLIFHAAFMSGVVFGIPLEVPQPRASDDPGLFSFAVSEIL